MFEIISKNDEIGPGPHFKVTVLILNIFNEFAIPTNDTKQIFVINVFVFYLSLSLLMSLALLDCNV